MKAELFCHPETPSSFCERVIVQLSLRPTAHFWLEFSVVPAGSLVLPEMTVPARRDRLWESTCFELFARPEGSSRYFEFNFSPSLEWAAYEFSDYRSGMRDLSLEDPQIVISDPNRRDLHFHLAVEALPELRHTALSIGLSAVLEESDGTKSYWALAHPPGAPDFHHPDCFALELPPPPNSSPRT